MHTGEIIALIKEEKFQEAILVAQEWVNGDSSNHKAWARLSYAYNMNSNKEEALKAIKKSVAISAKPHYLFQQGILQYHLKQFDEAGASFAACMQSCRDQTSLNTARLAYAKILHQKGENIKEILSLIPEDTVVWLDDKVTPASIRISYTL